MDGNRKEDRREKRYTFPRGRKSLGLRTLMSWLLGRREANDRAIEHPGGVGITGEKGTGLSYGRLNASTRRRREGILGGAQSTQSKRGGKVESRGKKKTITFRTEEISLMEGGGKVEALESV